MQNGRVDSGFKYGRFLVSIFNFGGIFYRTKPKKNARLPNPRDKAKALTQDWRHRNPCLKRNTKMAGFFGDSRKKQAGMEEGWLERVGRLKEIGRFFRGLEVFFFLDP